MTKRVFICAGINADWQETQDERLAGLPVEALPELIPAEVTGLVSDRSEQQVIPLRWRVVHTDGRCLVAADMARLVPMTAYDADKGCKAWCLRVRDYPVETITLQMGKKVLPEWNCAFIPPPVAIAAVGFMQEEAERLYGTRPRLPESIGTVFFANGRSLIDAFLCYPFDVNLYFMQDFFYRPREMVQEIFAPEVQDAFPALCSRFGLEAGTELREDYERYPYAVVMTSLLESLGIRKHELRQDFLTLDSWGGLSLLAGLKALGVTSPNVLTERAFYEGGDEDFIGIFLMLQGQPGCSLSVLPALRFYCQWLLEGRDEDYLAGRLLQLTGVPSALCCDFLRAFFKFFWKLSAEMKEKILREPVSQSLYEEMLAVLDRCEETDSQTVYPPETEAWEAVVDGYEFRLQKPKVRQGQWDGVIRMGLYKEDQLVARLDLDSVFRIQQKYSQAYEYRLCQASVRIAVLHWLKLTGLSESYGPYFPGDYEYLLADGQV